MEGAPVADFRVVLLQGAQHERESEVSLHASSQPRARQRPLAAKHFHLQSQDFQGEPSPLPKFGAMKQIQLLHWTKKRPQLWAKNRIKVSPTEFSFSPLGGGSALQACRAVDNVNQRHLVFPSDAHNIHLSNEIRLLPA